MKDTECSKKISEPKQNEVKTKQSRAISKDNLPNYATETKASKAWREAGEKAKEEKEEKARQQEEEERKTNN